MCIDCVIKPNAICFNCEVERACKPCLDLISQKTFSTDNDLLNRKPPNKKCQMLPWYVGEDKPKALNNNFEAVKKVMITAEKPMVGKRRFERRNIVITCITYMKHKDVPGNKRIFAYEFKPNETDKIDKHISVGCESDDIYESYKLFNFLSNRFVNREIENRDFKITG